MPTSRLLVTGATGYATVAALHNSDHSVRALVH